MVKTSENRAAFLIRNTVIGFIWLTGLVMLVRLIFLRSYNYDELSHAHMAWLVSVGEVPYRDFAANHFPFFWILVAPLMRLLPESPVTLMILRGLALLLNAVFIGSLGALIALEQPVRQRFWAAACFGLVAVSPLALHFLFEFRPDALANALLFSAILWLRLAGSRGDRTAFVGGFCIGVAVLINTKYVLFPFILGAVALVVHVRQLRQTGRFALGICLGFGAALLCGFLLLLWMRIPLDNAWRMVVSYNAAAEKTHIFGFGLARWLKHYPLALGYGLVGLTGCAIIFSRRRQFPGSFAIAVLLFLLVNLVATTRPWKQYVVSWLLLAAYFPARSLPLLAARLGFKAQIAAACCVFIMALAGFTQTGILDPIGGAELDRVSQDRVIEWVTQHVPKDGFVAAGLDLHPVFRRDAFFKVVEDMMVHGSDGLEEIMPQLMPTSYAAHFEQSGYEKELELRPPTVIVWQGAFTDAQINAINAYLQRHPDGYDERQIPGTSVFVRERKSGSSSAVKSPR